MGCVVGLSIVAIMSAAPDDLVEFGLVGTSLLENFELR